MDPTGHAFTEWDNKNVTDPKDRKDIVDATKEWHEAKTDKERADAHAKAEKARDKYRNDDEEGRDDGHTYKKDSNDISDRYDKDRKRDKKDKNDGTILYNAGSNDFYMVNVSTAAGQFRTTTLNDDKVSALKYTLNRDDYLKYVDKIAKESGARAAMQNIMDSVSLCRNEFRNDTLANLMGLYGKINSLVEKIGTVDKEMHYFRNELNRAPETLEELIRINYTLPADKKWAIMPVKGSLFHMQGTDGFFNLKFVSGDGYHEAVYNMEGSLLTADNDAINMGTYNYFPATIDSAAHTNYDVNPYFEHGNISDTWQKGKVRILAGASDAAENYAINITAAEIWRYKTIKKGSFKEVEIK